MGTPPQVLDQMKSGPYRAHMEAFAPSLAREARLCNDGTVPTDRLAAITAPTLALAGGASPAAMRDAPAAVAAAVSDGRYRAFEGQGHGVADEVLTPVLSEFFTSTWA